jgi:formylmethanofuran dehydrogenase subunit E-like metal-binding protein
MAELDALAERYGTDQFGVVTICFEWKARLRSYELLASACLARDSADAGPSRPRAS